MRSGGTISPVKSRNCVPFEQNIYLGWNMRRREQTRYGREKERERKRGRERKEGRKEGREGERKKKKKERRPVFDLCLTKISLKAFETGTR